MRSISLKEGEYLSLTLIPDKPSVEPRVLLLDFSLVSEDTSLKKKGDLLDDFLISLRVRPMETQKGKVLEVKTKDRDSHSFLG